MQGPQYILLCLLHLTSALTPEEKKTIVEKHNFYRSAPEPPAADMQALRWDRTLEELATSYAAKCIWEHNEERGFRGENLFIMSGPSLDVEMGLADWHKERDYYNFTADTCQEGQMCGHYTQMVWAQTERVGCGEKFCEKLEGFEESNMFLLVCNYEPPGNFQGEMPYTPGEACSSCPTSYICQGSLCAGLEQEETSTAPPGTTHSEREQEPTQPELGPEPTQSEVVPETTQSKPVLEQTQPELEPEATQSEVVAKPTQSEADLESTPSEEAPEATPSDLRLDLTQRSTEALEISTLQRMENSSPEVKDQTPIQPTSQVIAPPSQEYLSTSVIPSLPKDATLHVDKTSIDKAFSNDEPNAPTEKEVMIPVTVSMIPTKPARTQDVSVLVDKDKKPQEDAIRTVISQDQARRKDSIPKPPKTSPKDKKEKQKIMNLTSSKWKKQKSSSMRWNYKSAATEWTYFGRPVQGPHFVRAPRPCPYPCLRSQSKPPLWFPLYRTNHITPLGGYDEQHQEVNKPLEKPSFKQLHRMSGYKRGFYSLYLPSARQH